MIFKNKKAFFFTLLAATAIFIMIILIKPTTDMYDYLKIPSKTYRLSHFDTNIKFIERTYMPSMITDRMYKSMIAYNMYLANVKGGFATNVSEARRHLGEILWNDSIESTKLNNFVPSIDILNGKKLDDELLLISNIATDELKMNITFKIYKISIYQSNFTGAWDIGVLLNYSYIVNQSPLAVWSRNVTLNLNVPITGINDSFFQINTKDTNITYVKFDKSKQILWNVTYFNETLSDFIYIYDPEGISYLQRLANTSVDVFINGNSLSRCCGISTIIPPIEAFNATSSGFYNDRSYIDSCYILGGCSGRLWNISGVTNNSYPIAINSSQVALYNLTNNVY